MFVDSDLFVARPLPNGSGFTWTLTSRLGQLLHQAEFIYGPRDPRFTILGIELIAGAPRIWFPGDRGHVAIQLTTDCATDVVRACYELAHECIHLLGPTPNEPSNVLEEGLAEHFAQQQVRRAFNARLDPDPPSYAEASGKVSELLALCPQVIRAVRAAKPALSRVSVEDIIEACPAVPLRLAEALAAPFRRLSA